MPANDERRSNGGEVNKTLAILFACAVALGAFYVAEFDPWGWWSAHEHAARAEAELRAAQRPRPPSPNGIAQPRPEGTDSSVSLTPRRLILTATRPGRNAREGTADLGVDERSPQTYRAGAHLANGAQLTEVYADHVLLEREGVSTPLYLRGHEPAGSAEPLHTLAFVGGTSPQIAAHADSHDPLTKDIRVTPVYEGETLEGLEVHANTRSPVFAALGLQPGDRITAIEGMAVTDVAAGLATLRQLSQGAALQVTVERAGRSLPLALDGAVVVAAHEGQ
jgi:type II secretory pathway component PulC